MRSDSELTAIMHGVIRDTCRTMSATADRASRRKEAANAAKASSYCIDFFSAMGSTEPYRTEAEAIQAMAPIAVWFLGWLARQFAIAVIKALWRRWHAEEI